MTLYRCGVGSWICLDILILVYSAVLNQNLCNSFQMNMGSRNYKLGRQVAHIMSCFPNLCYCQKALLPTLHHGDKEFEIRPLSHHWLRSNHLRIAARHKLLLCSQYSVCDVVIGKVVVINWSLYSWECGILEFLALGTTASSFLAAETVWLQAPTFFWGICISSDHAQIFETRVCMTILCIHSIGLTGILFSDRSENAYSALRIWQAGGFTISEIYAILYDIHVYCTQ